jgi:hypothetical protein
MLKRIRLVVSGAIRGVPTVVVTLLLALCGSFSDAALMARLEADVVTERIAGIESITSATLAAMNQAPRKAQPR